MLVLPKRHYEGMQNIFCIKKNQVLIMTWSILEKKAEQVQ